MDFNRHPVALPLPGSRFFFLLLLLLTILATLPPPAYPDVTTAPGAEETDWLDDDIYAEFAREDKPVSYDPLEPLNRVFFTFNDKLYFWVLKPVNTVYRTLLPEDIRLCIGNFFENLKSPIYLVNNLAQGKFRESGKVLMRFAVNTTVGAFGLGDPAASEFNLESSEEDFGQTLGYWGAGEGVYICWPFLGPSNIRDSLGLLVDTALNPLTYLSDGIWRQSARRTAEKINRLSFHPTLYDDIKKFSLDPYVTMRQAFFDLRYEMIAGHPDNGENEEKSLSEIDIEEHPELASR